MSREWKPGDVAIADGPGKRLPITFFKNEDSGELMFNNGAGYQHKVRHLAGNARPLVVIDPEDREQVERLYRTYASIEPNGQMRGSDFMQAALREFANPKPPKPEEPQGQGAVVEDEDGARWLRRIEGGRNPWMFYDKAAKSTTARDWPEITAVRVLSPGVEVDQ